MPIPGNAEPGGIFGQQQRVQRQQSIDFSTSIPIKKRSFPIIRPPSPSREEKSSSFADKDSKNNQESNVPIEGPSLIDAKNTTSPGNSGVSNTSALTVKKEVVTQADVDLGQANVDFASKPQGPKPSVCLNPIANLGNKMDILSEEKSSGPQVPEIRLGFQTTNVKQEIFSGQTEGTCGLELATGSTTVELFSLGPKELLVPALEHKKSEVICHNSGKSDPSLLSLALSEDKLVRHDNNDCTVEDVGSQICANRSNWDLNTTMDVWEGSTNSNAFANRPTDIGGFSKTNSCLDEKSSLTTAGTVGLSLNKGKCILDVPRSNSSNASTQPNQQCKTDVSLDLRLAMPHSKLDASRQPFSSSDNLASISLSPNLDLQKVQPSAMNVNRNVKSEPVDENSKRDCSVGSSSSSNMGLISKFSSAKMELINNQSLETVMQSSICLKKLTDCSRSMKTEVVQEGNQDACKSEDATLPQSVARLMQHQESCASSSALPVPLMPRNSCLSNLSTCSVLTTSGDLSNQSERSFHCKELHDHNNMSGDLIAGMVSKSVSQDDKQMRPCNVGNSSVVDPDRQKLARVDEHNVELFQHGMVVADDDEKINISAEKEESFESDCESQGNSAVGTSMDIGENVCAKEDEEYEEGEVREPLQHSAREDPIVDEKKIENSEIVEYDSRNLQPYDLLGDQNISASDFDGKDSVKENREETYSNPNKDIIGISCEINNEDNSLQKVSDKVLEVGVDEKRSISVTPDKQLDLSGRKDVEESSGKEISTDGPTNVNCEMGVELGDQATDKVVKDICSGENDSTLSNVETSLNGYDAAKDSSNVGNKSRIINLSRASVVTTPCKTKSTLNRLLTPRSGKERYSDLDGEIQPRGNSDETYTGGSNKFAKDRIHGQSHRNSRPTFMLGKGRISGRFGPLRGEWDSDHDFASETSYGQSDYRAVRRKHGSSISDVELDCNGYGIQQDGTALGNNRRKETNDEFPSLRRTSLRRLSPGDRDGPATRGLQMLRRFPRNMSPNRRIGEAGSDVMGLRHGDKFMRHLSDDMINPAYSHPQDIYDELDGQPVRGNRNFSTMQRKGYPRIRSKSPLRSRTRSPGPWSSPRRRSPNGFQELHQHRSPALYRTGRMRSPDRPCFRDEMVGRRRGRMRSPDRPGFRDEMVGRRRGSPSFVARHPNDLRDVDSGREHAHPRSADSNRRGSPRVFPRNSRRADALDSREMGDGDEYMNGPLHSNKFHEIRGEGSIDERRKFIERRGPIRSFRPSYSDDGDNFRFHPSNGPRPFRFCPDADTEFVERSNMREREFDGRMKHQPLVVSRRIRNIEEEQDVNYRPIERVWHDDGFTDTRGKRRRF
ncbi:hypothetical protein DH2020_010378 [Rehmannia glutinosa]|uniref:Uncharacterized protein n=1 Tax=Rehmannia glutinosa TaxID=99300 RepID=A0ABR0XAH5_REHGL